jgi:hypothetical protein
MADCILIAFDETEAHQPLHGPSESDRSAR